jgi:hypothetical protein
MKWFYEVLVEIKDIVCLCSQRHPLLPNIISGVTSKVYIPSIKGQEY